MSGVHALTVLRSLWNELPEHIIVHPFYLSIFLMSSIHFNCNTLINNLCTLTSCYYAIYVLLIFHSIKKKQVIQVQLKLKGGSNIDCVQLK